MLAPLAVREVLSLELRHLAALPLASTFTLRVPGLGSEARAGSGEQAGSDDTEPPVELTTSPARYQAAQGASPPVACLSPVEYEALASALALGRITRSEALEQLRRKLGPLGHRITVEGLVGVHRRATGPGSPARAPHGRGDRVERWPAPGEPWECPVDDRPLTLAPAVARAAYAGAVLEEVGEGAGEVGNEDEDEPSAGERAGQVRLRAVTVGELVEALGGEVVEVEVHDA